MSYEVTIQANQDYIRVDVSGIRTPGQEKQDAINVWRRVIEASHSAEIDQILVVSEVNGGLPSTAVYEIVRNPKELVGVEA